MNQFKIRLAELEGGEVAKFKTALAEKSAGPLPVDWILTAAALEIYHGNTAEAIRLIGEARAAQHPGLSADCVRDMFFQSAAKKQPQVAAAIRLQFDPNAPAFR
ncbi:MAG TPA: hypothetical protein VK993_00115 [Chthoniobacterales bacterium]|nr:hypothetical protein [Chthoniobacterales bacterium]